MEKQTGTEGKKRKLITTRTLPARAQYGRSCENKRTDFKLTERPKSSKQCRFGAGGQQSLARVVIANISLATNHRCRTLQQCILNCSKKLSARLPQCNPAIFWGSEVWVNCQICLIMAILTPYFVCSFVQSWKKNNFEIKSNDLKF